MWSYLIFDLLRRVTGSIAWESRGFGLCQQLKVSWSGFFFPSWSFAHLIMSSLEKWNAAVAWRNHGRFPAVKELWSQYYKLSPLVAVRKPVDSIMGFWRGSDGLYVLFDVANTEPSGRSGKRMFCSLGKEKINLKCELKLRSSAGLRCTRDEFAYFNGNICCLITKAGNCFCRDLVRRVMCVCFYRRATARARGGWTLEAGSSLEGSFWRFGCSSESERLVPVSKEVCESCAVLVFPEISGKNASGAFHLSHFCFHLYQ